MIKNSMRAVAALFCLAGIVGCGAGNDKEKARYESFVGEMLTLDENVKLQSGSILAGGMNLYEIFTRNNYWHANKAANLLANDGNSCFTITQLKIHYHHHNRVKFSYEAVCDEISYKIKYKSNLLFPDRWIVKVNQEGLTLAPNSAGVWMRSFHSKPPS